MRECTHNLPRRHPSGVSARRSGTLLRECHLETGRSILPV